MVAEVRTNGRHRELDWSPNGQLLAVRDGDRIILLDLDTGEKSTVWEPDSPGLSHCPRFGPSSNRLAYLRESAADGNAVFIVPLEDGEPEMHAVDAHDFTWSSDGRSLVVVVRGEVQTLRLRDGSLVSTGIRTAASVHTRGPTIAFAKRSIVDNIGALDLAKDDLADRAASEKLISSSYRQVSPRYSPDGGSIAFASDRSGSMQIWSSGRDGSNLRKLTSLGSASVGSPKWSPDGSQVVFDASLKRKSPTLFVVGALGGPARRLTPAGTRNLVPSWSNDGEWIYFCSDRSGERNIWKIPSDGGGAVQVTQNGGWEAFEASDRTHLFYSGNRGLKTIRRRNLEDGSETEYPELGDAGANRYWAIADNGIYFVDTLTEPNWIQFMDFGSRRIQKVGRIGALVQGTGGLTISADGQTLLFTQRDVDGQDIVLINGSGE